MSLLRIEIAPPANGSQRVAIGGRLDTHTYGELDEQLAPVLAKLGIKPKKAVAKRATRKKAAPRRRRAA